MWSYQNKEFVAKPKWQKLTLHYEEREEIACSPACRRQEYFQTDIAMKIKYRIDPGGWFEKKKSQLVALQITVL